MQNSSGSDSDKPTGLISRTVRFIRSPEKRLIWRTARLFWLVSKRLFARISGLFLSEYNWKLRNEKAHFTREKEVHQLPAIFHYWSNRHLLPKLTPYGITDPEQFFFLYCQRQCQSFTDQRARVVSIGAGDCSMEIGLTQSLLASGLKEFEIECFDINQTMIDRGAEAAKELGLMEYMTFSIADFNHWQPKRQYDVIIANQVLHHVSKLERLFDAISAGLRSNGRFLTSDMIGRNGHMRWPEARQALEPFWQELPQSYRFNQILQRYEAVFVDHDCSDGYFEGIRSQDILPLLVERFQFELFIPFANIIMVFIDRAFGHNFNADADWDQDFIDRVHAEDEEGILNGALKPTQMLAVLRKEEIETRLIDPKLTPEFCVRKS